MLANRLFTVACIIGVTILAVALFRLADHARPVAVSRDCTPAMLPSGGKIGLRAEIGHLRLHGALAELGR